MPLPVWFSVAGYSLLLSVEKPQVPATVRGIKRKLPGTLFVSNWQSKKFWWSRWERAAIFNYAQICCKLPFLRRKLSDLAQWPAKQNMLQMAKNGNANPLYGKKMAMFLRLVLQKIWQTFSISSIFRRPTIFHGFHYHSLPYITRTAIQFSKQPVFNISRCYHFVK